MSQVTILYFYCPRGSILHMGHTKLILMFSTISSLERKNKNKFEVSRAVTEVLN